MAKNDNRERFHKIVMAEEESRNNPPTFKLRFAGRLILETESASEANASYEEFAEGLRIQEQNGAPVRLLELVDPIGRIVSTNCAIPAAAAEAAKPPGQWILFKDRAFFSVGMESEVRDSYIQFCDAIRNGVSTGTLDLVNPDGEVVERFSLITAPATVEPFLVEPTLVEPTLVEPATVEPATVEPFLVEPATVEPATVEPFLVEPATVLVDPFFAAFG